MAMFTAPAAPPNVLSCGRARRCVRHCRSRIGGAVRRPNAFVMTADPLSQRHIMRIIDFMASYRLPAMYQLKENVRAGGLMAYGASLPVLFRRGAWYVHRLLQGAKPAELPIEQATKLELTINLKTAKTLGLTIPPGVLSIADEVIE